MFSARSATIQTWLITLFDLVISKYIFYSQYADFPPQVAIITSICGNCMLTWDLKLMHQKDTLHHFFVDWYAVQSKDLFKIEKLIKSYLTFIMHWHGNSYKGIPKFICCWIRLEKLVSCLLWHNCGILVSFSLGVASQPQGEIPQLCDHMSSLFCW